MSRLKYQNEQTARIYEEYYASKYQRADRLEKQLIAKLLNQFSDAKTLLEVGCGTGHFTRWLNSAVAESYGVDVSAPMLREAKKLWPQGLFLRGDGRHLPFKDKSVDLVVYITSFEFIDDPVSALSEAHRVARKGFIFGLMNKNSTSTLRKRLQAYAKGSFYKDANFYSITDLKRLLNQNLAGKCRILFWRTTVFPKVLGDVESTRFPYGAFLGVAVELRDTN